MSGRPRSTFMLTEEEREALRWEMISPPEMGHKTTCPICSHTRKKSTERCIKITRLERGLSCFCYHCGYIRDIAI